VKERLAGRNLITLDDWTTQEIDFAIAVSSELKRLRAMGKTMDLLKNKTLFMIFFEQSTRTRNSMEAAMTQLGGHAHDLTPSKMQLSHGETPRDTAKVLSRMGEAIAIRNCFYNVGNAYLNEIARYADIPLISMQDDVYHPLQAIADLMTMQEVFGRNLRGLKVVVSWAYATTHAKPLSVPQSQILLFPRYGIDVVVATRPSSLWPPRSSNGPRRTHGRPAPGSRLWATWTRPCPAPTSSFPRTGAGLPISSPLRRTKRPRRP
jgi:ornithine carbamoyltransferase